MNETRPRAGRRNRAVQALAEAGVELQARLMNVIDRLDGHAARAATTGHHGTARYLRSETDVLRDVRNQIADTCDEVGQQIDRSHAQYVTPTAA